MGDLEKQKLWDERIEVFLASGLSQAAWCREQGLPAHQLSYWLRKFRNSTSTAVNDRWVSAPITTTGKSGVSLRIGNIAPWLRHIPSKHGQLGNPCGQNLV